MVRLMCTSLAGAAICAALLSLAGGAVQQLAAEGQPAAKPSKIDFDRQVAALLSRRCLECHAGLEPKGSLDLSARASALRGGESGPALTPGQPEDSPLWQRVETEEMPPKKPLSKAEKALLRQWIEQGARWGTDPIDRFRYSTETRAGLDWWSLAPVKRPSPPEVANTSWVLNPIDRFVLHRLEASRLGPSPPASKATLIRRLSFDLLGLPPQPEEVADFLADESEDAYDRLVERMLNSPHFGERWGRHWLDVVRFGESQGFERDKLRPNAWRYRDWVVHAFNEDLPFDQFTRWQLAGDVIAPENPLAVTATGFLVAAPWDEVGQTQQSAAMKAVVRQDELEDVIGVTGQTFLGLTLNCARCHDHKFDPVSQREYYALAAVFAGSRHGERESLTDAGRARLAEHVELLSRQVAAFRVKLEEFDHPVRERILAERRANPMPVDLPSPVARWEFDGDLRDAVGDLHGAAHGAARLADGRLILDGGEDSYVSTPPLKRDLRAKTLVAELRLARLDQRGGAALSVQTASGAVFDAVVYAEREPGRWMAGSNGFVRTQSFQGPAETDAQRDWVQIALVYADDHSIRCYRNGAPYGTAYQAGPPALFEAGKAHVLLGLRHSPPGKERTLAGEIERAMLFDRALSDEEVAALAGVVSSTVTEDQIVARLNHQQRAQRARLAFELSTAQAIWRLHGAGPVYAVAPQPAETTYLLARGDPAARVEPVAPAAIRAAGLDPDLGLAPDAPEGERRRKLAEWITNPKNPLTPRVIVNRLWHYHMGAGIVDTPNDFGFNGGRPTHPELLDWLAAELLDPTPDLARGRAAPPWGLKHIHRLIVGSSTYRQSSRVIDQALRVDAGNRLLWRKSPRRLDAEALRDSMLCVAGVLNPVMGGPGYQDFRTFNFNSQFYEMLDPAGHAFHRRTLYRTWVRSGRSEFLDVFDCPDPSTTSPRRAVTTTPLQALALLNNSFTLRMAEETAQRLRQTAPGSPLGQVDALYQLAYGRLPLADEREWAVNFINQHGLPALCRAMFNSNEFLYID
jgi:hypothetical protein